MNYLALLFFIYTIWNFSIYFGIKYNWETFIGFHMFIGGFVILVGLAFFIHYLGGKRK